MLREGNSRLIQNQKADRDLLQLVSYTRKELYPRIALNLIKENILGNVSLACKVADSKLTVELYLKNN